MFARGASRAFVQADIADHHDMNLCAGLVEACGNRLWFGPLADPQPRLADWVELAGTRQLVVPAALYASDPQVRCWRQPEVAAGELRAAA